MGAPLTMTRWVAASTLDRAARAIDARPGIGPGELASVIGLSVMSIPHVVSELRKTGEVLPLDVITWNPDGPERAKDPIQARILRRCKRGLVVVSELPTELHDESPEDVAAAVRRLRFRRAIMHPRGLWPTRAHHDPRRRHELLARDDD